MAQQEKQEGQQIQLKISDEVAKGVFANMAQVGHAPNGEEFVLDFMNIFPPTPAVVSRVVLAPGHMKRLVAAMQDNLKRYEEKFGVIQPSQAPEHKVGFRTE